MSTFTAWLSDPVAGHGVHFAESGDAWSFVSYLELAESARGVAGELRRAGIGRGDVVCVTVPTERASLAAIFGIWAAGATLCPVPPPAIQPEQEFVDHITAIFRRAAPSAVLTTAEFGELVTAAAELAGAPAPQLVESARAGADSALRDVPASDIALLQFTSGSTGTPRGVRVAWSNLEANFRVTARWTSRQAEEGVASWLPLYHDMGLIGCLLSAVATQANLWLMSPMQFIRNPARWLECFAPGRASMAAAPPSAFAYLRRRVTPERLAHCDLSGWRCVIVGAEPIDPAVLEAWAEYAAPAGFSRRAYVPAYGLAENTLAVASAGLGGPIDMVLPDWEAMGFGARVRVVEQRALGADPVPQGAGWLIGHGLPIDADDIGVRVVDEEDEPLPDGHLGEIVVTGSSVAQGYRGGSADASARFDGGALHTGDAGFVHDGQLYVVGRMGDSLQLHGRNIYVEDLDAKVAAAAELANDRISIVSTHDRRGAGVAVFVEAKPGPWADKVFQRLRAELGPGPTVTIVAGTRGLIRRTSSGKPRRRHMWQLLRSGGLAGTTIVEAASWDEPTAS